MELAANDTSLPNSDPYATDAAAEASGDLSSVSFVLRVTGI
jgi:hypothetical protein